MFIPIETSLYLEGSPNTYNVLLIGPTGAGKSRLINVIFNRNIVKSEASFYSVTKDIIFVKGRKINKEILPNFDEVILADTVGLCDTEWEIERTHNFIKSRLDKTFQQIDIVLIVINGERIFTIYDVVQNIRIMLDWLNYEKYSERFVFVFTKSSEFIVREKKAIRAELRQRLSLHEKTKDDDFLFTDFPHTDAFTEQQKEAIRNDFKELNNTIFKERQNERLPIKFELDDDNDGDKVRNRSKPNTCKTS